MAEEKRLSITFGDFSCEIVGYDEPFSILSRVLDIINATKNAEGWKGESSSEPVGKTFSEALKENAAAFDLTINQIDGRFVIASPDFVETPADADDAHADLAAPAQATAPIPTSRSPLHISVVEPSSDIAAPETAKVAAPVDIEDQDVGPDLYTAADRESGEIAAERYDETFAPEGEATELDGTELDGTELDEEDETAGPLSLAADQLVLTVGDITTEEATISFDATASFDEDAPNADEPVAEIEDEPAERDAAELAETKIGETVAAETETGEEIAADASRAEPADAEPAGVVRPRIVVDKSKAAEEKPRVSVSTTVVRSDAPDDRDETPSPERKRRRVNVTKVIRAENEEEDENFLFAGGVMPSADPTDAEAAMADESAERATADEEPLSLTLDDVIEQPEVAPSPAAEDEPKRRKGALNLGIFRRFSGKADEAEASGDDADAGFDRLRETAEAELPQLASQSRDILKDAPEPKLFAVSDGSERHDSNSPATFARQMGAQSLQDLLEASAAYVSIVEGKAQFSRRDVMQALNEIGLEKDYTPEARLKTFRKLLTAGAIVRSDDGMFAISHATRFGYETQLRARG